MAVANFCKFWLLVFGLFETFFWFDDLSLFFPDFTTFNLANCWIFAVFLDVTWLVAVYAKFGDSTVVDSYFSTMIAMIAWAKTVEFLVQLSSLQTNFQCQVHLGNLHNRFRFFFK